MNALPLLAAGALTCISSAAMAAPHTHDGFFLRLATGFGYENLNLENSDSRFEMDIGGFGGGLSIAAGGIVARNLAINVDFFGAVVVSPSVQVNDVELGEASDASVVLSGVGVGATYYIMPINLYVALSVGFGIASITEDNERVETDPGFAMNLMVGKEFWVGREWGIGVALQFVHAAIPTETASTSASLTGLNVMFSATFN